MSPELSDAPAPDLRIVSKNASDEEVAAVTAVVSAALDELAAGMSADSGPVVSAWQRSQRAVRSTVYPGAGTWRSF